MSLSRSKKVTAGHQMPGRGTQLGGDSAAIISCRVELWETFTGLLTVGALSRFNIEGKKLGDGYRIGGLSPSCSMSSFHDSNGYVLNRSSVNSSGGSSAVAEASPESPLRHLHCEIIAS